MSAAVIPPTPEGVAEYLARAMTEAGNEGQACGNVVKIGVKPADGEGAVTHFRAAVVKGRRSPLVLERLAAPIPGEAFVAVPRGTVAIDRATGEVLLCQGEETLRWPATDALTIGTVIAGAALRSAADAEARGRGNGGGRG